MNYRGFCGPSMPAQSLIADCERLINLFPERIESEAAPTGAALCPVPGQQAWITTTDVGVRAIAEVRGRGFAVVGTGLWEVYADGTSTRRGTVTQDNNLATISDNGIAGGHLFITSGGNGYCYVLATNALSQVLTGDATQGGFLSGRFLAFSQPTGRVRMSDLNDGLTWGSETIYGFIRSQAPDPWKSMLVRAPDIWLIGEQTGECWYTTDAYPQPFAPMPGAFFPWGTIAPFSTAVVGQHIVWVGRQQGGADAIVAAPNYLPQPISNYAVSTAVGKIASVADAEILTYLKDGHLFACCSFPQGNQTWVYDVTLGVWHERLRWNTATAGWEAWRPRVHGYLFGKHVVGDRTSGVLSILTDASCVEADGAAIRRVRIPPPLWAPSNGRITVDRLEVLVEPGLGLATGQGSDPQVMLRTSGDAKRWSSERMASAGKIGDFGRRVSWSRCGSSEKLWVPEVSMTDAVPWRLSGALISGSGFEQTSRSQ